MRRIAGPLLLIFQAMDAAGKDGAIKHVMSGVNPQGCQVFSFKAPDQRRSRPRLSLALHEVLAGARAHWHLQSQLLRGNARRARPSGISREAEAAAGARRQSRSGRNAFEDIRNFERYLDRNGVARAQVLPSCLQEGATANVFSSVSNDPEKNWKFSAADIAERGVWDDYMDGVRGHDSPHRHRGSRRGMSSRPTTSGLPASSLPRRSSMRSNRSTCAIRRSGRHSRRNWRPHARR